MRRRINHVGLVTLFAASIGCIASRGGAQSNVAPRVTISGTSYTVSASGASGALGGGPSASGPATLQNYIGHVVFAAGRGRMDIVEGGVETLFQKGDYLLFDSADVVVVRPTSHEFVAIPRDIASRSIAQLASLGVHIAITDVKVLLDSIGATDTIAGLPTRHFRMTVAFNMGMDGGIVQQRLGTENVIDYWVSSSMSIPQNPLLRANGFAAGSINGSVFSDLSNKVDSVAARMGTTAAVKTKSVTRLITGPGGAVETQQLYELSNIAPRDVDENLLILPNGLTAAALPGEPAPTAASIAVANKWRVLPARSR